MGMRLPGESTRTDLILLVGGMVLVLAGARIFAGVSVLNTVLVVAGGIAVGAAALRRFLAWRQAGGTARAVQSVFALGYAGCVLALLGFVPATEYGVNLLGLDFETVRPELRFKRFFLVASSILLACSLLPVLAAQWAASKGGSVGAVRVDALRVRQTAGGALSVALLAVSLIFIGYITTEFNRSADFSYFKTATPGESVRQIVLNMDGPLRAALFYPDVNQVKDEALVYLNELARVTGKVQIEEYDRLVDLDAAIEWQAGAEGSLYLRRGDAKESIFLGLDLDLEAQARLRVLDSQVHEKLLQLMRERRVVYLTTGHGELNDPLALDDAGTGPRTDPGPLFGEQAQLPLQALRARLGILNYDVLDLGLADGLGSAVPEDAAMLMVLGPQRPFHEAELGAIRRYLDDGGSLLLALEAGSEFTLDGLRDHLPFDFEPAMTLHDQMHLQSDNPSLADRRLVVTRRFTTHPSVRTAGRQSAGPGVLLIGPGSFRWRDDLAGVTTEAVLESAQESYADRNGNFTFDEDSEERGSYVLGVAVEREDTLGAGGDDAERRMRVLALGDAEVFSDQALIRFILNGTLFDDAVRWLDQEEAFSGDIVSEEDVPVVHTRQENVVWFYAIIFGAPAALLALGLGLVYRRRQQGSAEPEARSS